MLSKNDSILSLLFSQLLCLFLGVSTYIDKSRSHIRRRDSVTRAGLPAPGQRGLFWFGCSNGPPHPPSSSPTPYRRSPPPWWTPYSPEVHISRLSPAFCTWGPLNCTGRCPVGCRSPLSHMCFGAIKEKKIPERDTTSNFVIDVSQYYHFLYRSSCPGVYHIEL